MFSEVQQEAEPGRKRLLVITGVHKSLFSFLKAVIVGKQGRIISHAISNNRCTVNSLHPVIGFIC